MRNFCDQHLSNLVFLASRRAIDKLFNDVDESFYYLTLVTTGEGLAPCLAAWSREALGRAIASAGDPAQAREWLKWSWAESPYLAYGDEFFDDVKAHFAERGCLAELTTDEEREAELQCRLASMEDALRTLDATGLFGSGARRSRIVVMAEISPPDHTNTGRAARLNPGGDLLDEWLRECAEPEPV